LANKKININNIDLTTEINNIIKNYNNEKFEEVEQVAKIIAKDAVSDLKNCNNTYTVRSGNYNRSWRLKSESEALSFNEIVYNDKHYRLTHLLEKGHATSNGGRTRAFPHIAPVQQKASEELLDKIKKIYGGG